MAENSYLDSTRRFGGLDRLYGPGSFAKLRAGHVAVAGVGGVGSWCAEALARTGVGRITLIDLDHVAESNVNRQIHALSTTMGQSKVVAMAQRIHDINPECRMVMVDDFVSPGNVRDLIPADIGFIVDATDQAAAKVALILEARRRQCPLLVCGGAGGKTDPLTLRRGDISQASNDALLSKLRNTLRRQHGFPRAADTGGKVRKRIPRMMVRALWFDQPVILPAEWSAAEAAQGDPLQGLSCAGYGSAVMVTASMGLAAADEAVQWLLYGRPPKASVV